MMIERVVKLQELEMFATELWPLIDQARTVGLIGPLGSGKTTLVRVFARLMHVAGPIVSPTFTYVVSYWLPSGAQLHHFDLYRLTEARQFYDAGFDEYLNQPGNYLFIEWPEIVQAILPTNTLFIQLSYHETDPHARRVRIMIPPAVQELSPEQ